MIAMWCVDCIPWSNLTCTDHETSLLQHEVSVDPSQPATAFKESIYQKTGVPPERQKVMVKGGLLKNDADLQKLNFKPGQMIMVIGSTGELPKAPSGPVMFVEDMTDT